MRLLEGLAELVAPTRCGGCDLPGGVFCASCERSATALDPGQSCPRCAAPFGRLVCTECWEREFAFEAAFALGELAGPLARAVVLHKDAGERRLGERLGALLGDELSRAWTDWADVVTWVPPSAEALSRRGFDHGFGIASPVAGHLGVPARALLVRRGGRDQRALGRSQRAANTAAVFSVVEGPPSHVLLVDDVLTTGATADGIALELIAAGADAVRVAVLARAW